MAEWAPFSPTGYWAHYGDGPDAFSRPVIAITSGHALILNDEGRVVKVDEYHPHELLGVLDFPVGE